jgi:hypothetical protein
MNRLLADQRRDRVDALKYQVGLPLLHHIMRCRRSSPSHSIDQCFSSYWHKFTLSRPYSTNTFTVSNPPLRRFAASGRALVSSTTAPYLSNNRAFVTLPETAASSMGNHICMYRSPSSVLPGPMPSSSRNSTSRYSAEDEPYWKFKVVAMLQEVLHDRGVAILC